MMRNVQSVVIALGLAGAVVAGMVTAPLALKPMARAFPIENSHENEAEEARERMKYEQEMLGEPGTGWRPSRAEELAFAATLPEAEVSYTAYGQGKTAGFDGWDERGPYNLGGRTRAIVIDIANENHLVAASVSGHVWSSNDGGQNWVRTTLPNQTFGVVSISQDTRPGKTSNWYFLTGEGYGTSASGGNAFFQGNGLYKSTDNAQTWVSLAATTSNTPQTFDNAWDIAWRVAVDPSNTTQDEVYAAIYGNIMRSVDGGATWTRVLGNNLSNPSYFTDVAVTSTGVVYATMSSDGSTGGIWRSADGITWTKISTGAAGVPTTFDRIVLSISPSDESQVYFLGVTENQGQQTENWEGTPEWNFIAKYKYLAGDGAGANGLWSNRSQGIPHDGSDMNQFNNQGGYNLMIRVFPTDTNTVFIGGTNFYRSTNGFVDTTENEQIGGYGFGSTIPFYTVYPKHHSDVHDVVFYPSDPSKAINITDGGMHYTTDILATYPVWTELNNGYVTSQFYTLALDQTPSATNDIVLAGFQDYGTWFTPSYAASQMWTHPGLGDGSHCAISHNRTRYYMSRQEGKVGAYELDAAGNYTAFKRIDPVGATDYGFINPLILDPANTNRMYLPAGRDVWRHDDLASITLDGTWTAQPQSIGWTKVTSTPIPGRITAIAANNTGRIYFGMAGGNVYRLDGADVAAAGAAVPTKINRAPMAGGNVSCIAAHPTDPDKVFAVFSNYRIRSLFYSENAGDTWSHVGGNLEDSTNGTGKGPSCRWATIVPTPEGDVFFVGTSTGLYATNLLDGDNTVWIRQGASSIGTSVVPVVTSRASDGLVVAGTHGNGAFSTRITHNWQITGVKDIAKVPQFSATLSPNPSNGPVTLAIQSSKAGSLKVSVLDMQGRNRWTKNAVRVGNGEVRMELPESNLPAGTYLVKIEGTLGTRTLRWVLMQ